MTLPPRVRAFTLVEVIVSIVIFGVLAVSLAKMFGQTMQRTPIDAQLTQAELLAQERMDLILGQRTVAGYAAMTDPCPGPAICTVPSGFSVSASLAADGWPVDVTAGRYTLITVTVSRTSAPVIQLASLTAVVANY